LLVNLNGAFQHPRMTTGVFALFPITLVKLSPGFNFTNILRAAFGPIFLHH
jgi:hypothetical protein